MIETPYAAEWIEERRLTRLYFHHQASVLAHCRGAIAWPVITGPGYALVAAEIVPDGLVVVWEGCEWHSVKPVFQGEHQTYRGLSPFLLSNWSRYVADTYFWGGDQYDIYKHYAGMLYSSPVIQPPPALVEVLRWSDEAAESLLDEALLSGRLIINSAIGLEQHVAAQDPERLRGLHALRCLVVGMRRFPYRE